MSNKLFHVLVAVSTLAVSGYSAQEHVLRFQNHVRLGYDDNIYLSNEKHGSGFISDIVIISGKLNFSTRTDAQLFWQPELRYRFDADPDVESYQDLYGRLNHAMSQRAFLTVSDRLRYRIKDAQSGGGVQTADQNYLENNVQGAIDYTLSTLTHVKLGGSYEVRVWDDDTYGSTLGNNYDQYIINLSGLRQLIKDKTVLMVGGNYTEHEFDGPRGGYESWTAMAGLDQNFNPDLTGFFRAGYSFSTIDNNQGSTDNSTPYGEAGLDYNPSDRTSINGSMGYSIYRSENSVYNAQDQFKLGIAIRHDITAKISLAGSVSYIFSTYDSSYAYLGTNLPDLEDKFMQFSLRGSYQLNRNNFLEAGYQFSDRSTDPEVLVEYDRNRVDVGWRLRL